MISLHIYFCRRARVRVRWSGSCDLVQMCDRINPAEVVWDGVSEPASCDGLCDEKGKRISFQYKPQRLVDVPL